LILAEIAIEFRNIELFIQQSGYNSVMPSERNHKGDGGKTGILGENRLPKNHPRVETLGVLDEASSALGFARALCQVPHTAEVILEIQRDLYILMTEIATTAKKSPHFKVIDQPRIDWLESEYESLRVTVPLPEEFILPGDTIPGAAMDVARTVVRRAERRVIDLFDRGEINNRNILIYLNRLSSLCFVLELLENQISGRETTLAKK
jgi:cob(I)alamin adenosyltransferase